MIYNLFQIIQHLIRKSDGYLCLGFIKNFKDVVNFFLPDLHKYLCKLTVIGG